MKELTSYHVEFHLVGANGTVALGEVDNVSISAKPRKSVRRPRRGAPQTTVQGFDPFDISFKRGAYNGAIDTLMDAAMSPGTAPSLQAVATKAYPEGGTVDQYLYTGLTLGDNSFETSGESTDETCSFTADKRVKL